MNEINLAATGDICLKTPNEENPFEKVEEILGNSDVLFGNLEVTLAEKGDKKGKEKAVSLYEPPSKAKYLRNTGYDILNISNNHTADLGKAGLESTKKTLERESILYTYDNGKSDTNYEIIIRDGIKIGFLGYPYPLSSISISDLGKCFATNKINEGKVINDIKNLKNICDVVVVSIHWGIEHVFYPSPSQIEIAHNFVDNGADLILGHHPHVVQGIEEYNESVIVYSLGNFQFYPKSDMSDISYIFSADISSSGVSDYELIPVKISEDFKPYLPDRDTSNKIKKRVDALSNDLQNGEVTEDKWYAHIAENYLKYNLASYCERIKTKPLNAVPEIIVWALTPFCVKCYIGLVRSYRNTNGDKQTKDRL